MSRKVSVSLGRSVPLPLVNTLKVSQKAAAVAEEYLLPADVAFAAFEYGGRTYALTARLEVVVECMPGRTPDVVVREGGMAVPRKRKARFQP